MVIGLFLRHYKVYKGANYIPFSEGNLDNFNLFIGQNGSGKSSILEALDTFYNNREFVIHNSEKKSEAFVAPLFLIPKEEIARFAKDVQAVIPTISDFLFSVTESQSINYKQYKRFFDHLKHFKGLDKNYYLLLCSTWHEPNGQTFITFDSAIKKRIQEIGSFKDEGEYGKVVAQLKNDIVNYYSYQYIPVETSIDDFLRLESRGMQNLMSEDVKKRIEKTLNEKLPVKKDRPSKSILDIVNDDLNQFVNEVETIIQGIDNQYDFQKEFKVKARLTANHLTDVVISAFFSKRNLKKANKPIKNLSSGERKKALIDIAYAFLTQSRRQNRKVILGIDEPESSLHISMCYDQFARLQQLSRNNNVQLFLTTHWYGALPMLGDGNLYHIEGVEADAPNISLFSFRNYFEERGSHPNDIQFKSFFDLSSAIISSMRVQNNNWLIVESEEDRNYIECHLGQIDNLKILPVGGGTIVKLIHDYLYTPIAQSSDARDLKGKVFCLIDTDLQGVNLQNFPNEMPSGLLRIRRLQVTGKGEVELARLDSNIKSPTEIEESLLPSSFFEALKKSIEESNEEQVKEAFSHFEFDFEAKSSFVKGDDSIIYHKGAIGRNSKSDKRLVTDFIDKNKEAICINYCKVNHVGKPGWVKKLDEYFST